GADGPGVCWATAGCVSARPRRWRGSSRRCAISAARVGCSVLPPRRRAPRRYAARSEVHMPGRRLPAAVMPFAFALLTPALPAQQPAPKPLTAAAVMPDEPHAAYVVDLARMRAREVWDELDHSLLSAALREMEQRLGFPLVDLDRLTCWLRIENRDARQVMLWEGKVALPPAVTSGG